MSYIQPTPEPSNAVQFYTVQQGDIIPVIKKSQGNQTLFMRADVPVIADIEAVMVNPNFTPYEFQPPSAVPLPAAIWLLGSAVIALVTVARRKPNKD